MFFGGDAAFGPENIIWAVEHGHQAAISIHNHCNGIDLTERLPDTMNLLSRKMGMHEWSYSNDFNPESRRQMQHVPLLERFKKITTEVERGGSADQVVAEVERCLNCDVHTVFTDKLCIECDACLDICPTQCLTIINDAPEDELRPKLKLPALNLERDLFVSGPLPQTGRVMVKDENICVHCGLCAARCPPAAWDMQKGVLDVSFAADHDLTPECHKKKSI